MMAMLKALCSKAGAEWEQEEAWLVLCEALAGRIPSDLLDFQHLMTQITERMYLQQCIATAIAGIANLQWLYMLATFTQTVCIFLLFGNMLRQGLLACLEYVTAVWDLLLPI